jgi:hypothetical protein
VKTYRIALPALEVVLHVSEEPTHVVIEASYSGTGAPGGDEELKTWFDSILVQYEDVSAVS